MVRNLYSFYVTFYDHPSKKIVRRILAGFTPLLIVVCQKITTCDYRHIDKIKIVFDIDWNLVK